MPNNCYFQMTAKGKTKDLKQFLKYFIYANEEGKKKGKYLARTFLDNYNSYNDFIKQHKDEINKGEVEIMGWCAWSCWSCWFEGYPQDNPKTCVTLDTITKKYNINVYVESEETGMEFEETIDNEFGELLYSNRKMPIWSCKKCKAKQSFPSHYNKSDMEDQTCYECETTGEWKR
jgi:hypothetical protein